MIIKLNILACLNELAELLRFYLSGKYSLKSGVLDEGNTAMVTTVPISEMPYKYFHIWLLAEEECLKLSESKMH